MSRDWDGPGYRMWSDRSIARAGCANVLLKMDLLSDSQANKAATGLLVDCISLGMDFYVVAFLKQEEHGKKLLHKVLEYIYKRYYDTHPERDPVRYRQAQLTAEARREDGTLDWDQVRVLVRNSYR